MEENEITKAAVVSDVRTTSDSAPPLTRADVDADLELPDIDTLLLSLAPVHVDASNNPTAQVCANPDPPTSIRPVDSSRKSLEPVNQLDPLSDDGTPVKLHRGSSSASVEKYAATKIPTRDNFYDVFGALGAPTLLAFFFAGSAVFVQAFIQVYPAEFANALMKTGRFDNGDFWLIPETAAGPKVCATVLLVFCGCCYFALALVMLFFRHKVEATFANRARARETRAVRATHVQPQESTHAASLTAKLAQRRKNAAYTLGEIYAKFAHIDGAYHAYYVRAAESVDTVKRCMYGSV